MGTVHLQPGNFAGSSSTILLRLQGIPAILSTPDARRVRRRPQPVVAHPEPASCMGLRSTRSGGRHPTNPPQQKKQAMSAVLTEAATPTEADVALAGRYPGRRMLSRPQGRHVRDQLRARTHLAEPRAQTRRRTLARVSCSVQPSRRLSAARALPKPGSAWAESSGATVELSTDRLLFSTRPANLVRALHDLAQLFQSGCRISSTPSRILYDYCHLIRSERP